jgi:hypothetical protein
LIDFRYHLVSIVSIFLALAVGIVLGAGPLQGEIGATLKDEVAGLRDDKAQLNDDLTTAQQGTEGRDAYISAVNPQVLSGVLENRTVALVVLPGADSGLPEEATAVLDAAGARVVSTTSMSEDWVSPDEPTAAVRATVVRRVGASVGVDPGEDDAATRDAVLATLLTAPSVAETAGVDSADARLGLEALADAGLLTLDLPDGPYVPAQLVVVLAGPVPGGDVDAQQAAADQWVGLATALDAGSDGSVLVSASAAQAEGVSVLLTLRDDSAASGVVSGVDDADDPMGRASIVHALREQAEGGVGQYGLAAGAEAPFAPLPTPTPTP